ncbi:MAG: hypothetical protein Q8S35_02785 [bacterium]|nr:hypothetical protein [bacterium]
MKKLLDIILNSLPILVMIGLIPLIANDYLLAFLFLLVIVISLTIKRTPLDLTALIAGAILMTIAEYLFVSTGVETFTRNSLFGIMPIWLPILWAYGFVAIKRIVYIIGRKG